MGLSYHVVPTGTVLRVAYSHSYETPLNENLVLSSATGAGGLAQNVFGAYASVPLKPGIRNMYNAGLEQALGSHLVLDADYFWKYTRNAFDLDNIFTTAIFFPIEWDHSKMDGFSSRLSLRQYKGLTAYTTLGHTRARVFGPENGGLIFGSPVDRTVARIDHDQALQSTTHVQYEALNVSNKLALFNFLSTCSGTHFVPPRAYRAEVGIAF